MAPPRPAALAASALLALSIAVVLAQNALEAEAGAVNRGPSSQGAKTGGPTVSSVAVSSDGAAQGVRVGRSGSAALEDAPSELPVGEGDSTSTEEPPLFTLTLSLVEGRPPVKLPIRRGDNVMHKAMVLASELGLEAEDERRLVAAAREYGQVHRLLPLKEMKFSLRSGNDFRLQLFEGDNIDDLLKIVIAAGAEEAEAQQILAMAIVTMQEEKLIPVAVSTLDVRGERHKLSIFKGDDVRRLVREFGALHSLSQDDMQVLAQHAVEQAFMHRAVPMLVVPVTLENSMGHPSLEVWYGDNLSEEVERFSKLHSLGPEASSELLRHTSAATFRASYLPYAKFVPQMSRRAGGQLPELQAFANEEPAVVAQRYADKHLLSESQERELLDELERRAVATGAMPVISFGINVMPLEGSSDHHPAVFNLFVGDDLHATVDKFAADFKLAPEGAESVRQHATKLAQAKGLMPVFTAEHNVTLPNDQQVEVRLSLYNGDDPSAVALQAAGKAGANRTEAAALAKRIVHLVHVAELLPAVRLSLTTDDDEKIFEMFFSENVTEAVTSYAHEQNLSKEDTDSLLHHATIQAMETRMIPMLVVPVGVNASGSEELRQCLLTIYKGDDLPGEVRAFAAQHDLNQTSAATLETHVKEVALERGLLPLFSLPLRVSSEDGSSATGTLEYFRGDSVPEAVDRFATQIKYELLGEVRSALEQQVMSAGMQKRVFPILTVEIPELPALSGVIIKVFAGDSIQDLVSELAANHSLSPSSREALSEQLTSQATKDRVLPVLSIPVDLDGELTDTFHLYMGDNVTEEAAKWGRQRGLGGEDVADLKQAALARATAAGIIPALALPVPLEDKGNQSTATIKMFHGNNISQAVKTFIQEHNLDPSRQQELEGLMFDAAVDNRLLPEHEIPVKVDGTGSDPSKELMFFMFRGDSVQEAAAKFARQHGLHEQNLPGLVSFVEKQLIAHGMGKQEL